MKIGEVGYYTLAFIRKDDDYEEEYNGDKIVVEICDEEDYGFSPQKENSGYYHFLAKFLTSKGVSTNLKNIMVFGEKYFKEHQKDIINIVKELHMLLRCIVQPNQRMNYKIITELMQIDIIGCI